MLITFCIGHMTAARNEVSGNIKDFAKKNVAVTFHSHP